VTEEALFHEALSKPPADRSAFLAEKCVGNQVLRAAVEALLDAHEASGSFLNKPANLLDQTVDSEPGPIDHRATGAFTPKSHKAHSDTTDYRQKADASQVIGGRYTLLQKIGEGGMGEVWVAQQTEPVKRKVALKLVKTGMDSRGVLARFDQERQALAIMDHPNIARVLDGGMTPTGQPFFVMELVNGLSLTKFCDEARLTPRQRLELFIPICQAVQHAHQKGIVHRDLKPANILVTIIDGRPVPKVIDFGVAKATAGEMVEEAMTQFGAVIGTLEYMSPEQAGFSGADIDTRADIYSLGVILYELLTGLRPVDAKRFKKAALAEMIRIIQEEEPSKPSTRLSTDEALPSLAAIRQTEPSKLMAELRGELDWVVMKCLEKQRDRRYETANALARDIQRYLTDEPVEARPPSVTYRFQKMLRRNRVAVFSVGAVAAALLIGIVMATWQAVRATNAETEERKAKVQAEALATANAKLAEDESKAKLQAEKLATDNAKLAIDERDAKNLAIEATTKVIEARKETEDHLARVRAVMFTSQMARVAQIQEREPGKALEMLYDLESCPIDMRDASWCFAVHACRRRTVSSISPLELGSADAVSHDGKLLASLKFKPFDIKTRTRLSSVSLFELPSGKLRATSPEFAAGAGIKLAFSVDGSKLALVVHGGSDPIPDKNGSESVKPGKIFIWDATLGKMTATLEGHTDFNSPLAFSPDSTLLAISGKDDSVQIWDVSAGKERHVLKDHAKAVSALAFSPDGKRLATGGLDNSIKMWDVASGILQSSWNASGNSDPDWLAERKKMTQKGSKGSTQGDGITALDFSVDGTALAAGNRNWLIEIWDVATGQVRSTIHGTKAMVTSLKFHRNGKSVLAAGASMDRALKQWEIATGRALLTLSSVDEMHFDKHRRLLTIRVGSLIEVLDIDAPFERATLELDKPKGGASAAVLSRAGEVLAVANDARILLWDLRSGKICKILTGHKLPVAALALSPDGRILASSSRQPRSQEPIKLPMATPENEPIRDDVYLWDMNTGESLGAISVNEASVPSLAFSPDGLTLATISWRDAKKEGEQAIRPRTLVASLWDVRTRKLRFTLESATDVIAPIDFAQIAYHPSDGSLVTLAGRFLTIWNLETRKSRQLSVPGSFLGVTSSLTFAPDKRTVLVGVPDGKGGGDISFLDLATGNAVSQLQGEGVVPLFSPDGKTLMTIYRGVIRFRNSTTTQLLASVDSGDTSPYIVAISPDGQTLASATSNSGEDRLTIKLWDLSRPQTMVLFPRGVLPSRFSSDGKCLELRQKDSVLLWDLQKHQFRSVINTSRGLLFSSFLSPDGRMLAVIGGIRSPLFTTPGPSQDDVVDLYDTQTGTNIRKIKTGLGRLEGLAFSPDGKTLALATHSATIEKDAQNASINVTVWNLQDNRATITFSAGPSGTPSLGASSRQKLVLSPDGNTLAVGRPDGTIIVLNLSAPTKRIVLQPPQAITDGEDNRGVAELGFVNGGKRLIVRYGAFSGRVLVWNWQTGVPVDEPIPEHMRSARISPDGRYEWTRSPNGVELIDRTVTPPLASLRLKS
jgi:WD40 repeat protein/serine/threonine protein kinase